MPLRLKVLSLFLVALLAGAATSLAASGGATLLVGPGKPFATIQAAVDASADGDVIRVDPGTYNESVVIAGKQFLTLAARAAEGTRIVGQMSHAILITTSGGLETTAVAGDTQARAVGTGLANSTCVSAGADMVLDTAAGVDDDVVNAGLKIVTSGPDGVCETTANPNDTQALPVGQGTPNSSCVGAGANGMLETSASGDDVVTGTPAIDSGPNGICESTAVPGDDVRQFDLNVINSGADGICTTAAVGGDTQVVPVGQGDPNSDCVTGGGDNDLDTVAGVGDDVVDVPNKKITSGPNGICETTAAAGDFQAIMVGKGKPNGGCVAGGTPLKRGRGVKIQNFTLRAPNGFDGVDVQRSDFVELSGLILDGFTGDYTVVCTAAGIPFACCTGANKGDCTSNAGCTAGNVPDTCCNDNSECTGASTPFACCSNIGTGTCSLVATSTCGDTQTCTGSGTPFPCCTGAGTGTCQLMTGRHGVLVDFTAVKPVIKTSRARRIPPRNFIEQIQGLPPHAGYFIGGPGAQVSGSEASGLELGFAQFQSSDSAVYTGNTATGNVTGFALAGQANIIQRCVASQNVSVGFEVLGVGNILFQVSALSNGPLNSSGIGIRTIGRGTRIRSSVIQGNSNFGIHLLADPSDPGITGEGTEIFSNTISNNTGGGIVDEVFGVVVRANTIGPLVTGSQAKGVHLTSTSAGTLLENNRIINNGTDLVNEGPDNAGRANQFTPGSTPPPGFVSPP